MSAAAAATTRRRLRAWAGLLLAAAVAAALLGAHARWVRGGSRGFALADLPGFDAYVYAAMAERPSVFTVAPWGYRVLSPTLAHVLVPARPLRGLRVTTFGALTAAAALLFVFLRRLGFHAPAAWLGLLAFCVAAPVGRVLASPFTGDGLAVSLESALLVSVAAGAGLPLVLLLLSLGLLAKDVFLVFVPLTYVPLRRKLPRRWALAVAGLLLLTAIALTYALRWWWAPHIHTPHPTPDAALLAAILEDLRAAGWRPFAAALLWGLTPLAIMGALRACARPFLARYGYLVPVTLVLPFLAWLNVPATRVFGFFGDVPRLHIYALPLLIPLALLVVDRVWRVFAVPRTSAPEERGAKAVNVALLAATGLVVAYPFVAADSYRRYPLHGRREGLQVFLTCRMSLRAAERIARDQTVELLRDVDDEALTSPSRRRWYLMEGWDDDAVFGVGPVVLRETPAVVLVPCLAPQAVTVAAQVQAPRPMTIEGTINGRPLAPLPLAAGTQRVHWRLSAAALFRGDNVLTIKAGDGGLVLFESLSLSGQPVR